VVSRSYQVSNAAVYANLLEKHENQEECVGNGPRNEHCQPVYEVACEGKKQNGGDDFDVSNQVSPEITRSKKIVHV
jgi:hypothetical protein